MNADHKQQGVVLFMTLMVLVIMSITGLALLRGVDNSTLVANNVGYKEAAIIAADKGVRDAANLLSGGTVSPIAHAPASGYYASTPEYLTPPITIDWTAKATPTVSADDVDWGATSSSSAIRASAWSAADSAGNRYSYIIHRLCEGTGPTSGTACAQSTSATAAVGSTRTGSAYGAAPLSVTTQTFYRITVKVIGPKNTTSYSQAFLLI